MSEVDGSKGLRVEFERERIKTKTKGTNNLMFNRNMDILNL